MDLQRLTPNQLLVLSSDAVQELRRRGLVRSSNNPIGDYAEYLFCKAFGWKLSGKSERHADATGDDGTRYQIKARRLGGAGDRQLSALRSLPNGNFDSLAAVLFASNFGIARAALIPHAMVLSNATHQAHTNSWLFILRDEVWTWRGVEDVTSALYHIDDQQPIQPPPIWPGPPLVAGARTTRISKAEALRRVNQGSKLTLLDHHNTVFSNINRGMPGIWWLDIPIEKVASGPKDKILNILLYDYPSDMVHHLKVPSGYLLGRLARLQIRKDNNKISLWLSTKSTNLFQDVRAGDGGVRFAEFLQR